MTSETIGYHIVKTTYGMWLPGDERGHWSEAWDDEIGYLEPHHLHPGDPVRERMAAERMKHPPVRLSSDMRRVVTETMRRCEVASTWSVAALAVEPTHLHLLVTYSPRDIGGTAKWLGQQLTKAIHANTAHTGPVWAKGAWKQHVFDQAHWHNTIRYIEQHRVRRWLGSEPNTVSDRPPQ